eukprot:g573.t1
MRDWFAFADFDEDEHWGKKWAEQYIHLCTDHGYHWMRQHGLDFFRVLNWVERGLNQDGNSVPRFHMVWGTGWELVQVFKRKLLGHHNKHLLQIQYEHRVLELLGNAAGVTGVRGKVEGSEEDFTAEAEIVIVATGGINGNIQKIKENWYPAWGKAPEIILNGAHKYALGDLHDATAAIKGSVVNLEKQWNYAAGIHHYAPRKEGHGLSLVPCKTALWLNYKGERMGPEPLITAYDTRYLVERICQEEQQYSWQLLNYRIMLKEFAISGSEHNPAFRNKKFFQVLKTVLFGNKPLVSKIINECQDVVVADTLEELVDKMNALQGTNDVNLAAVQAAVDAYDKSIEQGPPYADKQQQRIQHARQWRGDKARTMNMAKIGDPKKGPFVAIREFILSRKSLGGIQTDLGCRVLTEPDASGQQAAIPGLYAIGDGNMLVVNGASVPNTEVWCQTIAVEANTVYQFSSWVNTMVTGSLAQLQFSINGSLLGDNFFAPSVFCEWEQFFELWDSGSNTSADICIVNQNVAVGGNDFGLDDISFVPVLSAESSVTVYVSDVSGQASVDASPDCNGNLGVATALAEGGFGPYTYLWSNNETTAQAINLEAGTQGVTITDVAGCTTELSVNIVAPEDPVIDSLVVGNTSCGLANGTLAVFAGDAGLAPFQYSIDADNFQEANTFENIAAGDYEVVMQDANGCTTTAVFAVAPSDSLLLEIEAPNGTALCLNTDLLLDAGDFAAYVWSTGENTATINPMELGDYAVTVTDEEGCTATATIAIGTCGKGWRIPNIFSPNGDGENDLFQPFIEEGAAEIMVFKVYNRWGTLVHDDIAPWDGNYQGKPHPAEVLIYMIQFNTNDGVEPLDSLQDQVPARPYEQVRERIVAELGQEPQELFAHFSEKPLAAASIGQAHRARLADGTEVVVKVQHLDIESVAEVDLRIIERIQSIVSWWFQIQGMDHLYTQVRQMIEEELNFTAEAASMQQIAQNLTEIEGLSVPEVHLAFSSQRVLTTTWKPGVKISNVKQLEQWGVDKEELTSRLLTAYSKMVFKDGFYHADPHPGNILVQEDGTLVLLDFGAVARLQAAMREGLSELIESAVRNDVPAMIDASRKMGFIAPGREAELMAEQMIDALRTFIQQEVKLEGLNFKEIEVDPFNNSLFELIKNIGISGITSTVQVPKEYVLLNRMATLLLGISTTLAPQLNPLDVVRPYVQKFVLGERGFLYPSYSTL